jgi:hypothetical protein
MRRNLCASRCTDYQMQLSQQFGSNWYNGMSSVRLEDFI